MKKIVRIKKRIAIYHANIYWPFIIVTQVIITFCTGMILACLASSRTAPDTSISSLVPVANGMGDYYLTAKQIPGYLSFLPLWAIIGISAFGGIMATFVLVRRLSIRGD